MKVFIGYDPRDDSAFKVAALTVKEHSSGPIDIIPLRDWELRAKNFYSRSYRVDKKGQMFDDQDKKPFSTQFSFTRFLVPALMRYADEWVLFMDPDMMISDDVHKLLDYPDTNTAVACRMPAHNPTEPIKMDGILQTKYNRKNWSSFMLMNPSRCPRLTANAVNTESGAYLHAMSWISDDEITELPAGWNYLAGYDAPIDKKPANVHFTLGTPDMEHYTPTPWDGEWWSTLDRAKRGVFHAAA